MRQIVLDTETTGIDPKQGHRVIEIGAVELVNRRLTGCTFHHYLQPDRAIDAGAAKVHGITQEMLADKPRFADIAREFVAFIEGAELIIHNAAFDTGFLNHELARLGSDWCTVAERCTVVDSLNLARKRYPGQKNNLDALCKRLGIDNSHRALHGALLDAHILAEVYLAMTGGQSALAYSTPPTVNQASLPDVRSRMDSHPRLAVILPNAEELQAHAAKLAAIDKASGGKCLWNAMQEPS